MATNKARGWIGVNLQQAQERQQAAQLQRFIVEAREGQMWELPPKELARQLQEADPWIVQELLGLTGWEVLTGYPSDTSLLREMAVIESRRMYRENPLYQWAVWLWTSWGLGDSVSIEIVRPKPEHDVQEVDVEPDAVAEIWQEFFTASRNQSTLGDDRIHELSNWLLVDGNSYLSFYTSEQDGVTTISELNPDEITDIISYPQNSKRPLFYKRQFTDDAAQKTWYYPDWQAYFSGELDKSYPGDKEGRTLAEVVLPDSAFRADTQKKIGDHSTAIGSEKVGTAVCVLHLAYNHKERASLWGWPLVTCSRPFLAAHQKFAEARLSVAMAKAAFVRRMTATTGSRGIKSLTSTIASNLGVSQYTDTNPPPAPGSTQLANKAVEITDLPMTTGASDAKTDNELFSWLPLIGVGLFPTSAGLDTSRWATAVEMDKAQSMLFERYQTYWRTQFERIVEIVIEFNQKFGGLNPGDYTVEVSIDTFSLSDFPAVGGAIGDVVSRTLTPLVDNGTLPAPAARAILSPLWRIILQSLGIKAAPDLTSDEAFGLVEEPEEKEEEVLPEPEIPVEPESAIQKVAQEIGEAMALGDVEVSEALAWAILTARDSL